MSNSTKTSTYTSSNSGVYTASTHTNSTVVTISDPIYTKICTICNNKFEMGIYEFSKSYNWGNDPSFERNICKVCYCKAMDKFFGINKNVDAEMILFKK